MPSADSAEVLFSQQIHEARDLLLKALQAQLDDLFAEKLVPQVVGVPFINFDTDPPQVASIKKVINCLYHAEEGRKHWEKLDTRTVGGVAKAAPLGIKALIQVYKSVGVLDDATPEIRWLIADNYHLIAPIFSKAQKIIKDSGWLSEFLAMDVTDKASTVINQGMALLGPDLDKWNKTNPLISTFEKISKLMETVSRLQDKNLTEQEKQQAVELMRSILADLDNNAFINKLSLSDFEDSKPVKDLLGWFKNIEADGFNFTKNSIQQYIKWANQHLSTLILLADQLEQQNYLKLGILSQNLCSAAESIGKQINGLLVDPSFNIKDRVVGSDTLDLVRVQRIEATQIQGVQEIINAEKQQIANAAFFQIIRTYDGKALSEISESDRVLLRQIYPKMQKALAHADISSENAITKILNTTGPEKTIPKPRTWLKLAVDGINYVASYVVRPEVTQLLRNEHTVSRFIANQVDSAQFKLLIAEKAWDQLKPNLDKADKKSLKDRVADRVNRIRTQLKGQVTKIEDIPTEFVPVKPVDLVNLIGTLTAIQKMKLSATVNDTRMSVRTLVTRHSAKKYQKYFSPTHFVIKENDPELVVQIKKIENNLLQLERTLKKFETLNLNYGVMIHLLSFLEIAYAASELKQSVERLSPESQSTLAPVLQQVMAYGLSFSNMSYRSGDLSVLKQLKKGVLVNPVVTVGVPVSQENTPKTTESAPKEVVQSPLQVEQPSLQAEKPPLQVEKPYKKEDSSISEYIKILTSARTQLLNKLKATLSTPITASLNPQEIGVPFINVEKDPPQLAAIKKMVNSLYFAEVAIKNWQGIDASTTFGTIAATHQGIVALSQVYKSFLSFTEATPEVQSLLRENYYLIEPVINGARDLINQSGWVSQFSAFEVTAKLGSFLGQAINIVQPQTEKRTQTASLVQLLSGLPGLLSSIADTLDTDEETSPEKLQISQGRVDAIIAIFELVFEENASFLNVFKGYSAIAGLIELYNKIKKEGINLQESTIEFYQQWLEQSYPSLLLMFDEVETRYYLKPGLLSAAIALEIDKINDKLNDVIEYKPNTKLKKILLSYDLGAVRKQQLQGFKSEYWFELFKLEDQHKASQTFFSILKQYSGKSFSEITPRERVALRLSFATIQLAMVNSNLDVSNAFVIALNLLETTVDSEKSKDINISIAQLLNLEPSVNGYLKEREQSYRLKIDIVDKELEYIKLKSFSTESDELAELTTQDLRAKYLANQQKIGIVGPGKLSSIPTSSLNNVRGNLAYIQELQLSSLFATMKEQFTAITKDNFSSCIQDLLNKPKDQKTYVVNLADPLMVRQIKEIDNGLYHLQTAFLQFEQMKKSDRLVAQAKGLLEILSNTRNVTNVLEKLTPELQQHYGPLVKQMLALTKKIQLIDYNKQDWSDLTFIIYHTRNELLKRTNPRDPRIEKAFFDAGYREVPVPINANEGVTRKAIKLGVKYAYLASPELEKARKYLNSRYENVFGQQPSIVRAFTRNQLANDAFMSAEIRRLKLVLNESFGFNIPTAQAILKLVDQIQRAGSQASEVAGMVNILVTDDFIQIKKNNYEELISKLSQEEDYLCLKPGTLINPAMAGINQICLSAALELDMPFSKKLSLLDDAVFINIIISQTNKDLEALNIEQQREPLNTQLALKIAIKKDKISFLKQQIELFAEKDLNATKNALLDMQFEVYLRDHLINTTIREPIVLEYERIVRKHYNDNKAHFLSADDCTKDLTQAIQYVEKNNVANYLIVSEAYTRLYKFSLKLPAKNQDVKDYIDGINKELINGDIPIEQRALKVKSLPNDSIFIQKLSSADNGTHFLRKFIQFLAIITSSIKDAITKNISIIYIYKQKIMEQAIKNIERSLKIKDELNPVKEDEDDLTVKDEETRRPQLN